MPQTDPLILKLIADVARYNRDLDSAQRLTDQKLDAIERRGMRMGQSLKASFSNASRAVIAFAAGLATIQGAQALLAIADEAKKLDAQLRLATAGFGSFGKAQDDVRRIAADTRAGLSETASLYGNFARGAKELGASQDEAARATETFSKTLKISGASAAEAGSATLQFGQALAAGALRGDELNSILEASPRLARLLAESMGQPIGEIRKLGEEGALTSDKLLRALTDKRFTQGIDDEFRSLPVTFDEAMTQVENAAIITFGAFDRGGRFSSALANFIADGSEGFADMEKAAEDFGVNARAAIEGLAGAFEPLFSEARSFFDYLNSSIGNLNFDLGRELGDIDKATGWLSKQGLLGGLLTGNSVSDWQNGTTSGSNLRGRYKQRRDQSARLSRSLLGEQWLKDNNLDSAALANMLAGRPMAARPTGPVVRSGGGGGGGSRRRSGGSGRSADATARRAEQDRLRAIRDEAANERELARLDDEVLAAKAAIATAAEDLLRFELESIDRERKQRTADVETQFKLGELTREEADQRILMLSELSDYRKQRARLAADELAASRKSAAARDTVATLQAEAQMVDARKERRAVEMRILELAYQDEEAMIRRAAANGEIADLDEALANMRRRRAAAEDGIARNSEGPLARYRRDLSNADRAGDAVEDAVVEELQSVRDGITSAVQKTLGVKNPILAALINSFIEQQLIRPFVERLSGAGGGGFLGSVIGAVGSLFGGGGPTNLLSGTPFGRASGGPVAAGRMYRINEGATPGRVEAFIPNGGGHIVPLGRMNALAGGQQAAGIATVRLELSGDIDARIQQVSGPVAVEVVRASAPTIIKAASAETLARSRRPSL